MSTKSEYTGKTVEAAIAEAESALGKSRDQLHIEVVSYGSRGVFGIGGEPARVIARDPNAVATEPPAVSRAVAEPVEETDAELEPEVMVMEATAADLQIEVPDIEPTPERRPRSRARRTEEHESGTEGAEHSSVPHDELAEAGREALEALLEKMGFEVEVTIRPGGEHVTLDVAGENLGILIGRRGDSLAALQFMVNVILSKQFHTWPRVVIDVQGYRSRREESLTNLGKRVADRVKRNRRPFTLEAMPANDRRIIHLTLHDRTDVETYSIGEGQSRRVVIAPKR